MYFPFSIDLSRSRFRRVLDVAIPIVSGGTLVIGGLLLSPASSRRLSSTSGLGYYSKLVVVVFACYVLGVFFIAVIDFLTFWVLMALNRITKNRLGKRGTVDYPWRSRSWQRVTTEMLGTRLAPAKTWAEERALIEKKKATSILISDPDQKASEVKHIAELESDLVKLENQWRTWYFVLKEYFNLPDEQTRESFYIYSFLHSLGWAGVLLMVAFHCVDWLAMTGCALVIAYGIWGTMFRMRCLGYFGSDNQIVALTAATLHELRDKSPNRESFEQTEKNSRQ